MEIIEMRKAKFIKNVNCPMTEEMFSKILEETDKREIPFSEYIREAIKLKFKTEELENGKS
jgi:UDP-glucose 6-dehydrogenase